MMDTQEYLDSIQIKDVKGQNFLLHNDKLNNIVILSSDANLKFLCDNQEVVLADGTFEYCVKFFLQLFTLHSYCKGFYVPLVFCLLKNKNASTYAEVFRVLAEKCRIRGLKLQPKNVVIDFETFERERSLQKFNRYRMSFSFRTIMVSLTFDSLPSVETKITLF